MLGPADSVSRILAVGQEFNDAIFTPMVYAHVSETAELLSKQLKQLDTVVFSGIYPYSVAHKHLHTQIPTFYVPRDGTGLYRTLFQLSHHEGLDVERVSFDTLNRETVEESYRELQLDSRQIECLEFRAELTNEEMISFHWELFRQGKVSAAVTCLHTPFDDLKRLGVPIFRVLPTASLIRQTLTYAHIKGESRRMQAAQIAIMIVNLDDVQEISLEYSVQRMRTRTQAIIVDFCEELGAALFPMGGAEFIIVTTRGAIEEMTGCYVREPLLPSLRDSLQVKASAGLGLGELAINAENRARVALQYARKSGGNCVFASVDENTVLGPMEKMSALQYQWRHEDGVLRELREHTHLSATTLSRIRALVAKLGKPTITANELATGLEMTSRSARRVLVELQESRLAEVVGEDQSSPRGRPSKVYRILI